MQQGIALWGGRAGRSIGCRSALAHTTGAYTHPPTHPAAGDCSAGRASTAERDACPLLCPEAPSYFNGGLFVMSPSSAELAAFGALLAGGRVAIGGYAEQDFLNAVYKASHMY